MTTRGYLWITNGKGSDGKEWREENAQDKMRALRKEQVVKEGDFLMYKASSFQWRGSKESGPKTGLGTGRRDRGPEKIGDERRKEMRGKIWWGKAMGRFKDYRQIFRNTAVEETRSQRSWRRGEL